MGGGTALNSHLGVEIRFLRGSSEVKFVDVVTSVFWCPFVCCLLLVFCVFFFYGDLAVSIRLSHYTVLLPTIRTNQPRSVVRILSFRSGSDK